MIDLTPLRHPKQLWDDLYLITHTQIQQLKEKVLASEELDRVDSQKLDSCYVGLKRLLEIEAALKTDELQKASDSELLQLVNKATREHKESPEKRRERYLRTKARKQSVQKGQEERGNDQENDANG